MSYHASRAGRQSSEATDSTTLSEGMARALQLTGLYPTAETRSSDESDPLQDPSALQLKRNLSLRSVVSTTSSNASRMNKAVPTSDNLRTIGLGSCGTVFEIPGSELAFKKGTTEADIWRDFCLTNKVHNAIAEVAWWMMEKHFPNQTFPRTPSCHEFHKADDEEFWSATLPRFPTEYRTKQALFEVDRILPLPQPTREALISQYFDQDPIIQQEAKDDKDNKDCLVRVYLGERESLAQQDGVYDSLRNFPMRLNMLEDLDLEVTDLANGMALALATLHWQAQVDGMDVEFVLGTSATWDDLQPKRFDNVSAGPKNIRKLNFKRRENNIYMLDFDKASEIELTLNDINTKLVPAFLGNDPYYPMPNVDEALWHEFAATYMKASGLILRNRGMEQEILELPGRFLEQVEKRVKENEEWDAGDNIVFED